MTRVPVLFPLPMTVASSRAAGGATTDVRSRAARRRRVR
ncbi:hypothetical protein C7S16_4756 [Burkholderia thailandensis]|uniref:Uncharacterized protein n=1 Tax=Burkholderia thailandensis TaxID=57975 RepID=A0AAW9CQ21_BURTH|nr:hypothetical protein [Burkholderia thailandensis]MDW9252983.1 hypothetical protein [Burkholderia thailandensis]